MAVYVDELRPVKKNRNWPYPNACHMTADSTDELLAFAVRLRLSPSWLQKPGQWHEHFDLTPGKRHEAVRMGAIEETWRESIRRMRGDDPATPHAVAAAGEGGA